MILSSEAQYDSGKPVHIIQIVHFHVVIWISDTKILIYKMGCGSVMWCWQEFAYKLSTTNLFVCRKENVRIWLCLLTVSSAYKEWFVFDSFLKYSFLEEKVLNRTIKVFHMKNRFQSWPHFMDFLFIHYFSN